MSEVVSHSKIARKRTKKTLSNFYTVIHYRRILLVLKKKGGLDRFRDDTKKFLRREIFKMYKKKMLKEKFKEY